LAPKNTFYYFINAFLQFTQSDGTQKIRSDPSTLNSSSQMEGQNIWLRFGHFLLCFTRRKCCGVEDVYIG